MEIAVVTGVVELTLVGVSLAVHRRQPFTGGALSLYRAALVVAALSLACIVTALALTYEAARTGVGVGIVAAIAWQAVRVVRSWPQPARATLHAEAEAMPQSVPQPAPQPQGYTVRTAPRAGQRSARVRRIEAMGGQ